ncbi:hypothetical protein GCM10009772_29430 [Pseudonocardia alni subsp. carboxydivorans]|uniref:Phosphotransferase family enzyme n=1 Tax=Pseudonocardia alni subsp. carboxydivorans TaxID=415010 RepID=A0ABU9AFN9_PSEA5
MGAEGRLTPPGLAAWPGLRITARLGGGHRGAVWAATDGSRRLVVHRSRRTPAALDWELDLTGELRAHGFRVPDVVAECRAAWAVVGGPVAALRAAP